MSSDSNKEVDISAEKPAIGRGERFVVSLLFVVVGLLAAVLLFDLVKSLWLGIR